MHTRGWPVQRLTGSFMRDARARAIHDRRMSEPKAIATHLEVVVPGLLHWTVHDDRIGNRSDAWALTTGADTIVVDPLPLETDAVSVLGNVRMVVLTIQSHQRSAWNVRKHFKVPVFAPKGSEGLEEQPDYWYEDGAELPFGLRAFHSPGPCEASYALLAPRPGGQVLFVGDLLVRPDDDGPLAFVPSEYQDAAGTTRGSVRRLLALDAPIVCSGHGAAVVGGGVEAMRAALEAAPEP
jgi:glyoxylase-like metal-dependent hydrolase (beta-lactamase superfamily II)